VSTITSDAIEELQRARDLYPEWPDDIVQATALMLEEAGEVLKDANNFRWNHKGGSLADVRKEIIQTIAMCYRLLLDTPVFQEESS
jgi:hypothetical protein